MAPSNELYWDVDYDYRHLKHGRCRERLSLNFLHLPKDTSSKRNSTVISALPRSVVTEKD